MSRFFKVSGGGNDFLALPEPETRPSPSTIRAWCRRGHSLGADGIFLLQREAPATDGVPAVTMEYVNADGSSGELCLNGTRCAARLAFHLRWAEAEVEIRTGAGPIRARAVPGGLIALTIPPLQSPLKQVSAAIASAGAQDATDYAGWHLDVGVPHFVLVWPHDLETAPVHDLGQRLVHHSVFATAGANIDFVRFPRRDLIEIRSFERGVNAETLACGTGVIATAAVGLHLDLLDLPASGTSVDIHTRGGFPMHVAAARDDQGRVTRWMLTGDARLLATGTLLPEASDANERPRWG